MKKYLSYIPGIFIIITIIWLLVACADTSNTPIPLTLNVAISKSMTPSIVDSLTSTPVPTGQTLTNQDMCNLLSKTEVENILNGSPVKIESNNSPTIACTFSSPKTYKTPFFIIAIDKDFTSKEDEKLLLFAVTL